MFYFDDFFGKKVLKSTLLNDCEHFFTTRDFILNFGTKKELLIETEKNIEFLAKNLGISKSRLYRCKQVHSANIEYGQGNNNFFENTDGIILTEPGTATFLNFADCIPLILYDSKNKTGGVIHAGWRGTALRIQQAAVKKLMAKGSNPKDIKVAIGAGIGKCCFDVNQDVFENIFKGIDISEAEKQGVFTFSKEYNKFFADLKLVNKMLLNEISVRQVDISGYCTSCSSDIFFSYRKEKGDTARHSAVLKIKG